MYQHRNVKLASKKEKRLRSHVVAIALYGVKHCRAIDGLPCNCVLCKKPKEDRFTSSGSVSSAMHMALAGVKNVKRSNPKKSK